tara:strand:- start:2546 stop:3112 length:567 start_codon:yes stop_codon:yes gene_type:complete
MASELTVQTIKGPTSGGNANKILVGSGQDLIAPGHVVQVVRRDPTAAAITRYSSGSTSYVNTGLAINITPKLSNSIIIVSGCASTGVGANTYLYVTLKRVISGGSTTDLGFTASGNNYGIAQHGVTGGAQLWHNFPFEYADAPNTTNQVTYQIWAKNHSGSATHYFGWTGGTDTTHNGMFMTAMEIAQ